MKRRWRSEAEERAHGKFESNVQVIAETDTLYVGNMNGVGRIYQQTFIDCRCRFRKLYDRKTPITAADAPQRRVVCVL